MFQAVDRFLFELVNMAMHNSFFDFIIPVFSQTWIMWLGAAIGIAAYAVHCWRSALDPVGRVLMLVLLMGLSAGATDLATSTLKHSIARERPCQEVVGSNYYSSADHKWIVVDEKTTETESLGGSMPSSPAAACMAVAAVLSMLFYRSNPWVYLLPFSVGFAQIYVGKNYPFDIVAGWLIGILSVFAVWWACQLVVLRFSTHRRLAIKKSSNRKKLLD
ncbi:MAG: phosphatase PAP2 family protein [Mailhella sp.]|nr:phosphatase PAP2 family protein [Mailhella sp.]